METKTGGKTEADTESDEGLLRTREVYNKTVYVGLDFGVDDWAACVVYVRDKEGRLKPYKTIVNPRDLAGTC